MPNPPVEIRAATAEDRHWAAELLAGSDPWLRLGATLETCLEMCRDPRYEVYVAMADGERLGVAILQDKGMAGSPYLKSIAVAEEMRSRGVGSAILDFAEARFRGEARWLFLCVSSFNARARALYERRGYAVVGELPDQVVDGAAETVMRMRL
ncbi:MAG: GNAT family N-acetyltransferase [Longimicrobiales bacterium]